MSPAFWLVRAANLAAVLLAAKLLSAGRAVNLVPGACAALALCVAEGASALTGRPAEPRLRAQLGAAATAAHLTLILWLAHWTGAWGMGLDLGLLAPACLAGAAYGPWAGAAAAGAPAALVSAVLAGGLAGAPPMPAPYAVLRAAFFVLAGAASGAALGPVSADAARRARETLGRLRAAQMGEYLSFALFQLRDYAISISSLSEAIALSAGPAADAKQAERLERLRKAAGELNAKLSRVLGDQSALTTARPPTQTGLELEALAREIIAEARAAFAPAGIAVTFAVEARPPAVKSDRRSIEMALLAVLQNALEACSARGGGTVSVILRREGPNAELEIADDGGGVPESVKPLLFEPFAASRRDGHGLGLGLAMSRRFLERLGGEVRLKSRAGYTAVLLVVPLERELPKIRLEESTWAGRRAA